jgi:hypothetical protein
LTRVTAPLPTTNSVRIEASLLEGGQARLCLNGDEAVTADTGQLFNRHPQEDLCIGHDNRNPLDEQAPKGRFNGKISKLAVTRGR